MNSIPAEVKKKSCWEKTIVNPNSRPKMLWDLVIILLSVYNSILIPYKFAYSLETNISFMIFDRMTDVAFAVDIFVNFRTAYENSKTGKWVCDTKSIAMKYVFNGRFGIDLIASIPLEEILILNDGEQGNFRFLSMLKIARLLRLGRMISFLKNKQKLKFSIKIGQLMFFIFLIIHWINWIWYYVTVLNKDWIPPKDIDFSETEAFDGDNFTKYLLFYYYGMLTLIGSDLLPTSYLEIIIALLMVLAGTVFTGVIIGEFTALLSNMTK